MSHECKICSFTTDVKYNYDRHLKTKKHKSALSVSKLTTKIEPDNATCDKCGMVFSHVSNLYRHKKQSCQKQNDTNPNHNHNHNNNNNNIDTINIEQDMNSEYDDDSISIQTDLNTTKIEMDIRDLKQGMQLMANALNTRLTKLEQDISNLKNNSSISMDKINECDKTLTKLQNQINDVEDTANYIQRQLPYDDEEDDDDP